MASQSHKNIFRHAGVIAAIDVIMIILLLSGTGDSLRAGVNGEPVSMLTYNIYGYRKISARRIEALVQILRNTKADVIALQEVNWWFMNRIRRDRGLMKRYHVIDVPFGKAPKGRLYTLSRYTIVKWEYRCLSAKGGHGALITYLRMGKRLVPVVNIHLESSLEAKDLRIEQLKSLFGLLDDDDALAAKSAIVMGDFNFGDDGAPEASYIHGSFVDLWVYCWPESLQHTWDMLRNPLAIRNAFPGEKSRRLDRILIHGDSWKGLSAKIVGNVPLKYGGRFIYPSDHYGVIGVIEGRVDQ